MTNYHVFDTPPHDYQAQVEVAGCCCEWDGKLLFLKRSPHKSEGEKWGIPGGKLDSDETPEQAVIREVFEETGIVLHRENLRKITHQYIRFEKTPEHKVEYIFHIFFYFFDDCPPLNIHLEENTEGFWGDIPELLKLPLMNGAKEVLEEYHKFKEDSVLF